MLPRWRDRKPTFDQLWGFMVKIYPPENLPAQRIAAILKSESTIISAFAESCHSRFGLPSYLQLKQFFKDPSRSAEYFLGDINAQLAIWSLTTLLRGPSNLVESHDPPFKQGVEFGEPECIPYDTRCSTCIHHLSCASVSSPVLVKFPRPDPAVGAGLDEDLNKAIVRFLLVCKQEFALSRRRSLPVHLNCQDSSKAYELLLQKQVTKKTPRLNIFRTLAAAIKKIYVRLSFSVLRW